MSMCLRGAGAEAPNPQIPDPESYDACECNVCGIPARLQDPVAHLDERVGIADRFDDPMAVAMATKLLLLEWIRQDHADEVQSNLNDVLERGSLKQ